MEDKAYFGKPWKNSDAVLIVEGEKLHVHTSILSLASPVFDKMFGGNFKESYTKHVELTGKTYEMIEHMLKIIYPNISTSLELNTNVCINCLPENNVKLRNLPCKECRDNQEMRPYCTLCIGSTDGSEECIKCKHFFAKSKVQKKRHIFHLQELYDLSQEYIMNGLYQNILTETVRLSRQLTVQAKDITIAIELMIFAESIECEEAVANCLRHISSSSGYHSPVVNNSTLDSLSNLLIKKKVSTELRKKLMGLILKRQLKELVPRPSTEEREAWDDVLYIANEMIKSSK